MTLRRVALDALPLQVRSGGVATYVRGLVRGLAALRPDLDLLLFGLPPPIAPPRDDAAAWPANVRQRCSVGYPLAMGEPFGALPRLARLEQVLRDADLFHATAYAAPRTRRVPVVLTVHDLTLLRLPALGTPALRRTVARVTRLAREARLVIADSAATERDLVELCGLPPRRVRVVPLGVDAVFHLPASAMPAGSGSHPTPQRPYLLHVGTLEPRKNLPHLIATWATLRRARGFPHRLVLAGESGWGATAVAEAIERHRAHDAVEVLGRIAASDLPRLYAGATALVFPSLYEGFGLPVLEAMACGTPVIASNAGALPEVAGDAALLVDAGDAAALGQALARVLDEATLRDRLRHAGLARAARFTWERTARETLAVYEEAMGDE